MSISDSRFKIKELNNMQIENLEIIDALLDIELMNSPSMGAPRSSQNSPNAFEWLGDNEYGNTYYYPVLPKFTRAGRFDSINLGLQTNTMGEEKIPFGGIEWDGRTWTPEDFVAPVTNESHEESSLQVSIVSELVENNVQDDSSGNKNFGFVIGDYSPEFELNASTPIEIQNTSKIKKTKKDGAF